MKRILDFFRTKNNGTVLLLIAVFFALGIYIGFNHQPTVNRVFALSGKDKPIEIKANFESFWKVWNLIDEKYPGANKISDQERVEGAISGLLGSLDDPYSVYFNKEETKSLEEDISGSFEGIGVEVGIKNKILTVISPLKNNPGYKAGIKPGDKILKINNVSATDLTLEEAIKLIRGKKGTTIVLTVLHEGDKETKDIKIIRDVINIPTLDTEKRDDGIFIIKLYGFPENSASLFRDAIKQFEKTKSDKLILDLRENPGGYLGSSIDIVSRFLPAGKTIAIEDYGENIKQKIYRSSGYDLFKNKKLKFVILIDNGSASASEIVAGALQDYGIAKLVGSQSYGKGSVQEVVDVTSDTILKITVAKWLTPKGISISERGLTPDYVIDFIKKDDETSDDPQMDKAIELLNNWPEK